MVHVRLAHFPQATAAHLDAVAEAIGPHAPPAGRLLFASGPVEGGWQVVQVWEDAAQLHAFNDEVFLPALARLGPGAFPAPPQVTDLTPTVVDWGVPVTGIAAGPEALGRA